MAGQMWFGTPGYMNWVPCPRTGMGMSKQRWSTSGTYLNGGGYARNSTYGHQQYDMAWEMITSAQSELLESYIDGIYGDDLIYFMDPFTMAGNVLPTNWAAPGQIERGAPSITTTTPTTFGNTAANTLGYPARTVTPVAAGNTRTLIIPVPPGMNLYFGWHGTGTGTVTLTPTTGSVVNAATAIAVTSTARTNVVLTNPGNVAVRISAATTMAIAGMIATVGTAAPAAGGFMPGRGNSGCRFLADNTQISGYSAPQALDRKSVSATLKEVGAWL